MELKLNIPKMFFFLLCSPPLSCARFRVESLNISISTGETYMGSRKGWRSGWWGGCPHL